MASFIAVRLLLAGLASLITLRVSAAALDYGFPYGQEKIRGVNLGGWLVLEVSLARWDHETSLLSNLARPAMDHPIAV